MTASRRRRDWRWLASRVVDDRGNAIVEFVFLALVVLVPLVYILVAVVVVQRNDLAVTNAAREAGRAIATADTVGSGMGRAQAAVALALDDQGYHDGADLSTIAAGGDCGSSSATVTPSLRPGATFTVCVARAAKLPGVPGFVQGRGIRTIGSFEVHVDDFRNAP